ncbi:snoRNA-binding rRNA-processing protein [Naganishia albida]|nr:snoRNA-binding rRNA-processing protein [Naganishia albida]
MPKASSLAGVKKARHTPLHVELNEDAELSKFGRISSKAVKKQQQRDKKANAEGRRDGLEGGLRAGRAAAADGDREAGEGRVETARMSRKILDLARKQQDEIEAEMGGDDDEDESVMRITGAVPRKEDSKSTRQAMEDDDEEEDSDFPDEEIEEEEYAELEIDPEDYETLAALGRNSNMLPSQLHQDLTSLSTTGQQPSTSTDLLDSLNDTADDEKLVAGNDAEGGRTLADIIFEKMGEQAAANAEGKVPGVGAVPAQPTHADGGRLDPRVGLNPKVVEVYTKVGILLSRYKSGPLPRALKILPSLPHWAQLLALTNPAQWTPHAAYACTRIFVSNLKPAEVQVFLQGILLDQVRDNIADQEKSKGGKTGGRLDVQLYEALKKGLYKPAAWFKGILFPLCESGCSLKEATVVASVLSKVSVPVLHSAAALMRLAGMDYSGPNSLFIRVLLDKKYALPYKVVDALVFHYIRLANSSRSKDGDDKLPVLWHQSLLVFVQRYGADLTPEQKDALLDVIRARPHPLISAEIRREILNSVVRGEPRPEEGAGDVDMV